MNHDRINKFNIGYIFPNTQKGLTVKRKIAFCIVIGVLSLAITGTLWADDFSDAEKQLTPENMAKLEAGKVVLLDQAYKDPKTGKMRGKGMAIILVNKAPQEVWEYLPKFNTYKEFMPRMKESTIYDGGGGKVGATYVLDFLIKKIKYHCLHELDKEKMVIRWTLDSSKKNDIASTTGYWRVKAHGDKSLLFYTVAVDTGMAVPQKFQDYLTKKDLPNVVKAVKKRIESGGTYKK